MADIRTEILYEKNIESLEDKYQFLKAIEISNSAFRDWHYTHTQKIGYKNIKT